MDALKETRFAAALEGASKFHPESLLRASRHRLPPDRKVLARFPYVAKYYTVLPVPAEPAPEKENQKQAGKARNTKTTAVTAPEPRIVNLAWTENVKREDFSAKTDLDRTIRVWREGPDGDLKRGVHTRGFRPDRRKVPRRGLSCPPRPEDAGHSGDRRGHGLSAVRKRKRFRISWEIRYLNTSESSEVRKKIRTARMSVWKIIGEPM